MTRFTVRVELHDAVPADYGPLHDEMSDRGFIRTIRGKDGRDFQLPPGEYNEISDRTPEDVRAAARQAIRAVGKRGAVLVTPSHGRWWSRLDEAENTDDELLLDKFFE